MSTTGKITLGHHLFTEWATERGAQEHNPSRPSAACLDEIRKEMNRRSRDIPKFRWLKTIHGMWFWLDSTTAPVRPRMAYRRSLKRITAGYVPIDSWDIEWRDQ